MRYAWLVYNVTDARKNNTYIEWMQEEAEKLDIHLELMLKENFEIGVKANSLFVSYHNRPVRYPEFAIVRNIDETFSMQLELLDIPIYNSSYISRVANHKARSYQLLAQHHIPMADTLFLKASEFNSTHFSFRFPCIIKEAGGRGGQQIYKADTLEQAVSVLKRMDGKDICIQKMGQPGKDVRVFVIGKQIIASILRESKSDFRSNYTLGGESSVYTLSPKQKAVVDKIISLFDFGMVGIDFIFDEHDNFLFNEIEDVVGSRTLSVNTDINIVHLYLKHILDDVSRYS